MRIQYWFFNIVLCCGLSFALGGSLHAADIDTAVAVESKAEVEAETEAEAAAEAETTAEAEVKEEAEALEDESPTGWDFAFLPILNFTSDRGTGYGAYVANYYHGDGHSPSQPYKASIGVQFYQATKDYSFHKLLLDFPNIFDTGVRLDVFSGYQIWDSAWYFGIGDATPRLLPKDTPENFYEVNLRSLWMIPTLRIPLAPKWQLYWGNTVRNTEVKVYPGSRLDLEQPVGVKGGLFVSSALGVMVDTRNKEPNTESGVFSELSARLSHPWMGSKWQMWGANLTHRQWLTLVDPGELVFAYRIGLDLQDGKVPFFHQHVLGGSQWVEFGGNRAMRGLANGRYRGNVSAYSNFELRWQPLSFSSGKKNYDVLAASFVDVGRVWNFNEDSDPYRMHYTFGGGPRLSYNDVFIIRLDFAVAYEHYNTSEDPLGTVSDERKRITGMYILVHHPF